MGAHAAVRYVAPDMLMSRDMLPTLLVEVKYVCVGVARPNKCNDDPVPTAHHMQSPLQPTRAAVAHLPLHISPPNAPFTYNNNPVIGPLQDSIHLHRHYYLLRNGHRANSLSRRRRVGRRYMYQLFFDSSLVGDETPCFSNICCLSCLLRFQRMDAVHNCLRTTRTTNQISSAQEQGRASMLTNAPAVCSQTEDDQIPQV